MVERVRFVPPEVKKVSTFACVASIASSQASSSAVIGPGPVSVGVGSVALVPASVTGVVCDPVPPHPEEQARKTTKAKHAGRPLAFISCVLNEQVCSLEQNRRSLESRADAQSPWCPWLEPAGPT